MNALTRRIVVAPFACLVAFVSLGCTVARADTTVEQCAIGSYRLDDASDVDIARSGDGTLRWRRFDGTTGALHRQDDDRWIGTRGWSDTPDGVVVSFPRCGAIRFGATDGTRLD